jgi:hypothetical protein
MAEPRLPLAVPIVSGGRDHAVLEAIERGFTPAPPAANARHFGGST